MAPWVTTGPQVIFAVSPSMDNPHPTSHELRRLASVGPLTMAAICSLSFVACPDPTFSAAVEGRRPAVPGGLMAAVGSNPGAARAGSLSAEVNTTTWLQLKDLSYERRAEFNAGVDRLEMQVDAQIKELQAKRATISGSSVQAWDFAMKEMEDSRAFLRSAATEASKANEETWTDRRDKVGRAWERTQDAYDKVKASTTN